MPATVDSGPATSGLLEIADREFRLFKEIIYAETGIHLKDTKRFLVASRLGRRLRTLGLSSFREYYEYLQSPGANGELRELINSITTNTTSFFRESDHFDILRTWLPRLCAAQRSRVIRIWCAACSTGEEPYSIVMTALEALGNRPSFRLLASDIDTGVLQAAKTGVYPAAALSNVPSPYRKRYFNRGVGDWEGYIQVKPQLKELVDFRQFNLVHEPWDITDRFDAVFLRNVAIYFDRDTQSRVFRRLVRNLEPHGLLFVGSSDSLFWLPDVFSPVSHAVYQASKDAQGGGCTS